MQKMSTKPIKTFISYSTEDEKMVSKVVLELDRIGIYTFFASIDLRPGMDFIEWINNNIDSSSHVLLFWSKKAFKSYWVKNEWQSAFHEKIQGKKTIIPIILDETPLPSLLKNTVYVDGRKGLESTIKFLEMALLPGIEYKDMRRARLREITGYDEAKNKSWELIEKNIKKEKIVEFRIYDFIIPVEKETILLQILRSLPIRIMRLERKERSKITRRYTAHLLSSPTWFSRMEENMKNHRFEIIFSGTFH